MLLRKAPAKRSGALAYPEELRASGLFEPPPPYRVLFTAQNGRGVIAEGKSLYSLDLGPAEPMLSRATDPRQRNSCRFRDTILRWSFYSALHVDRVAPLRQSQPAEGTTYLEESGRNLTPVLLSLFTNLDYEEQRDELLGFLRTALPQFRTLTPTPEPVSNNVVLQWVERDVSAKFSASDLSDGYLRLLCLAVICCNPHPPRLICIDEPEVGLHPLVLPLVGGLLRRAAQRSQVIVLTHSPDLLYGMPIESIGVMRRADGEAQIVWPKDVKLLCNLVSREVAGERELDPDRLRQAFSSGELDTLG